MSNTTQATDTITVAQLFDADQVVEILRDAAEIDAHLSACIQHVTLTGCAVPMRTSLGFWEEMRLDQRAMIMAAKV
jgi:hypothetical protein